MKRNPIYQKDELLSNRSPILPVLMLSTNAVLAFLVLINIYSVSGNAAQTGEIRYSAFLELYYILLLLLFLLILLLAPALSAPAISGERERKTLSLLLSTALRPVDIILGKLFSVLSSIFLLLLSTAPILACTLLYGGIRFPELFLFLLFSFLSAFFSSSLGLFFSSAQRSSTGAIASTYIAEFLSFGLMLLLFFFLPELSLTPLLYYILLCLILPLLSVLFLTLACLRLSPL